MKLITSTVLALVHKYKDKEAPGAEMKGEDLVPNSVLDKVFFSYPADHNYYSGKSVELFRIGRREFNNACSWSVLQETPRLKLLVLSNPVLSPTPSASWSLTIVLLRVMVVSAEAPT